MTDKDPKMSKYDLKMDFDDLWPYPSIFFAIRKKKYTAFHIDRYGNLLHGDLTKSSNNQIIKSPNREK